METIEMKSEKAVRQDIAENGFLNNDRRRISNKTNEVTYNVTQGYNYLLKYYFVQWLKFATLEDALEYLASIGATIGRQEKDGSSVYFSLTKQQGCCFSYIESYSIKN